MLPQQYSAQQVQIELDRLQEQLNRSSVLVNLVPQANAPVGAIDGTLAVSDGTNSGFDGASGAGLYRYNGSTWVHLG